MIGSAVPDGQRCPGGHKVVTPPKQEKPDPAIQLAAQQVEMQRQKAMADIDIKNKKLQLDEQKLAAQLIKDQNVENIEKEKLASKIIEQGLN